MTLRPDAQTPPLVAILLPLEGAPRVLSVVADEWEASRLCDWISTQSDLAELLDRAIESRESWRRRETV